MKRTFTPEHCKRISLGKMGQKHPHSEETKLKIKKSHIKRAKLIKPKIAGWNSGKKFSEEHCRKISLALTGRKLTKEHIEKMRRGRTGKYKGKDNWMWKGGLTPENVKIRNSPQMNEWRRAVFKRDNYVCQLCHKKGGRLNAHHIDCFSERPELRFDIMNGITLCVECHLSVNWMEVFYKNFFILMNRKKCLTKK